VPASEDPSVRFGRHSDETSFKADLADAARKLLEEVSRLD
jgi:hypothetical protein